MTSWDIVCLCLVTLQWLLYGAFFVLMKKQDKLLAALSIEPSCSLCTLGWQACICLWMPQLYYQTGKPYTLALPACECAALIFLCIMLLVHNSDLVNRTKIIIVIRFKTTHTIIKNKPSTEDDVH